MASAVSRPRKTVQDLLALPDDVRAELIQGEIYVTPAPTPLHQDVAGFLYSALRAWASARKTGRVYAAVDVHLSSGDVVQPDVLFVRKEHDIVHEDGVHGSPDLVVEVISSHPERDRIVKRQVYARNGVPEYWIVDRADRAIEVLRLETAVYRPAGYFTGASVLAVSSLPGFSVPLVDVFTPQ